jgi:hypothetical protein
MVYGVLIFIRINVNSCGTSFVQNVEMFDFTVSSRGTLYFSLKLITLYISYSN